MQRNHDLAMIGRRILCERLRLEPIGPEEMLGSMAAMWLPGDEECDADRPPAGDEHPLHNVLLERFGIEVPVYFWPAPPRAILRISAQAYNHPAQYERLAEAIKIEK